LAKGSDKTSLNLVDPASSGILPPRRLGQHGLSLWNSVQGADQINDAGGIELLTQACAAADRVEALAQRITADGEVVNTRSGQLKAHPGLRDELAGRAFIVRTLERLGLNLEAVKPIGRPPHGWRGDADE
jgi:hypothetical protein